MENKKHCVIISFGKDAPSAARAHYRFTVTEKCPLGHSGCRACVAKTNYCTRNSQNGLRAICLCNSDGGLRFGDVLDYRDSISGICGAAVADKIISDLSVRTR